MEYEFTENFDLLEDDAPENPENDEELKDFAGFTRDLLLTLGDPKSTCCRSSLACGVKLFAKSRKNQFTERAEELCQRLSRVRGKKHGGGLMDLGNAPKGYKFITEPQAEGETENETARRRLTVDGSVCAECTGMLLRGCFISAGRLSNPLKTMCMELSMPNMEVAEYMSNLLGEHGLAPKINVRKNEILLYYKNSDVICDVLNYMGAFNSFFKLQNVIIYKNYKSTTNRKTNCDTSNITKSVIASSHQTAAINAILAAGMMDALPRSIRETAMIRLENPDASLEELVPLHPSPITKAGIHHRLQKAVAFAEQKGYIHHNGG